MKQAKKFRDEIPRLLDPTRNKDGWAIAVGFGLLFFGILIGGLSALPEARSNPMPEMSDAARCDSSDIACIVSRDWVFFDDFCSRAIERELDKFDVSYVWTVRFPAKRFDGQGSRWLDQHRQVASIPGNGSLLVNGEAHHYTCLYSPVRGARFWASLSDNVETPL